MLRKIGISILVINLLSSPVFAQCDFSKLEKVAENYQYSVECHKAVGDLYKLKVSQARLIEIVKEDSKYWQEKAIKYKNQTNYPVWVAYGLGVIGTLASVWAAGQVGK